MLHWMPAGSLDGSPDSRLQDLGPPNLGPPDSTPDLTLDVPAGMLVGSPAAPGWTLPAESLGEPDPAPSPLSLLLKPAYPTGCRL